jgi:hypothetical protein
LINALFYNRPGTPLPRAAFLFISVRRRKLIAPKGGILEDMNVARPFFILAGVAFLSHAVWEYLHIGLYTGYQSMEGILPVWMFAACGDLFYTLLIIGIISLAKQEAQWIKQASRSTYLIAAVLGSIVALMVEYKGLYLGRWQYLPLMPIVPFLGVGLSPLLQMTFLTPLSLGVTKWIEKRIY